MNPTKVCRGAPEGVEGLLDSTFSLISSDDRVLKSLDCIGWNVTSGHGADAQLNVPGGPVPPSARLLFVASRSGTFPGDFFNDLKNMRSYAVSSNGWKNQ